jgi:hypothetical protein
MGKAVGDPVPLADRAGTGAKLARQQEKGAGIVADASA